jgi:phosphohistidine phosphatase
MKLLIMRHGAAEQRASSDTARSLTPSGWHQAVDMAHWLQTQPIVVEYVLASPTRRTQQTFEALCSVLPQLTQLPRSLDLTPQGKVDPIIKKLQYDAALQLPVLLLISHIPLVSQLVGALCPHAVVPQFSTSTLVAIEFSRESGRGVLQWTQSPQG